MSELTITQKRENEKLTIFADGRADSSTAVKFDAEVRKDLEGVTFILMDLEKLSYISSSGLRVLLSLHKIMRGRNGKLIVIHPTKMVMEVFKITGFVDLINIEN